MALRRAGSSRFQTSIWPGFVDAMTALLLVMMFLLTIFMVVQFVLRETITSQDTALDDLSAEVLTLSEALGLEQQRAFALEEDLGAAEASLSAERAEIERQSRLIDLLTDEVESRERTVVDLEARASALASERDAAREEGVALGGRVAELEAEGAAARTQLAAAREEISARAEAARLAVARREALEALVADLRAEAETRETSLSDALASLEAAREQGRAREVRIGALQGALSDTRAQLAEGRAALAEARDRAEALDADLEAAEGRAAGLTARLDEAEAARLAEVAAAEALRERLGGAEAALSEEEAARLAEAAAAEALRERLARSDAELDAASLRLDAARREAEETLTLLAAAREAETDLEARLAAALTEVEAGAEETARLEAALAETPALRERLEAALAARAAAEGEADQAMSEADRQRALLAVASEELEDTRAQSEAEATRAEALRLQVAELQRQVASLRNALGASEGAGEVAEEELAALRGELNEALARRVAEERARADAEAQARAAEAAARAAEAEAREQAERAREAAERARALEAEARAAAEAEAETLARYQSDFFAALADIVRDREGVSIVGDRFVLSSEVLFEEGSDDLSSEGRAEIARVAATIRDLAAEIPAGTDWILRVDGHTDNLPLTGRGPFADNWELSQARALSVVRYLSEDLGIPPERLSANGFGEHRPLVEGDTPAARAANRRIELKLTER